MIEVRCPKCGKIFVPAPQHIFRDRYGFYCSWTCYNHRKEGRQKRSRSHGVDQCNRKGELITVFKDAKAAADAIFGSEKIIRRACAESILYRGYIWRYHYDMS